ncbi:MAG: response regulator transcription factor [Verrucomicrobium sp.]
MEANTVYLLDDEPGMLKALTRLLKAEGFVVKACLSIKELQDSYRADCAACLVLDMAMPDLNGLEVQAKLQQEGMQIPIIFLTGRADVPMCARAIKSGAMDFLTKPVNDVDLIRAVKAGLGRAVALRQREAEHAALAARAACLTPKEYEVMRRVAAGKMNKEIAAEMGTGEQNIKIHRAHVMQKMGCGSVADLVRMVAQLEKLW